VRNHPLRIFNSRDDSVSIEGGGRKTVTETVAPK
jgi:hypothetical protein